MNVDTLAWNADGLMPAIAQDASTGEVLMMAWMNRESLQLTLDEGIAVYFSRSRQALWRKGETSGHTQTVKSVQTDCDRDALLLLVDQAGVACHTGRRGCFYHQLTAEGEREMTQPRLSPDAIYGAQR